MSRRSGLRLRASSAIGAAEGAQIAHQRKEVGVADGRPVEVDHRQGEARPLHERAQRAHVDEGRDARRRAAENLALGDRKTLPELGQRVAADQRRDEEAVGLQRAADLDERPGQIVDGLQREQRHGEVEAAVRRRQALEIADRAEEIAAAEARQSRREPDDAIDLAAGRQRRGGVRSGRAEIRREGEAPLDQRQALAELLGRAGEQEIGPVVPGGRAPRRDRAGDGRARGRRFLWRRGGHAFALCARRGPRAKPGFALTSVPCSADFASDAVAAAPPWTRRAAALASRFAEAALDTLYPPTCLACRAATEAHGALCPRCWSAMRFIERPFCERLGTPFEQDLGEGLLSPQAMADPPVFARARAVARFEDGPARKLAHRLKYSDRAELARPIARWMARAGADILADADLIAPVPLHPLRLWRRRFNQAALLAREVSRETGKPCDVGALLGSRRRRARSA